MTIQMIATEQCLVKINLGFFLNFCSGRSGSDGLIGQRAEITKR